MSDKTINLKEFQNKRLNAEGIGFYNEARELLLKAFPDRGFGSIGLASFMAGCDFIFHYIKTETLNKEQAKELKQVVKLMLEDCLAQLEAVEPQADKADLKVVENVGA